MTVLTFIIPVRHFQNAKNWQKVKSNLEETLKSISMQTDPSWQALVIANTGSDLPQMPHENIKVKYVDFDPNPLFEQKDADLEVFHDAFRIDKGRRVLKGMLDSLDTRYFMIVDDDDYVNKNITSYVKKNIGENGWYIEKGYIWPDQSQFLLAVNEFYKKCGTCFIVRKDLYNLPKSFSDATQKYICDFLGSHMFIKNYLENTKQALLPLPFEGAIYRAGHGESHSKSNDVFRRLLINNKLLKTPVKLLKGLLNIRLFSVVTRSNFRYSNSG